MPEYYSQHGEDFLLWSVFEKSAKPGFFVEVGGLDGIRFSNTYSFEREGWKGVCVEPHPDYFPLLKKNRSNSLCVDAAAGNREGQIEFYAEPRGDFSTMMANNVEDEAIRRKMEGYRKVIVPIRKLDDILQDARAPFPIDIVSIDVEGAEMEVLEGFNLRHYQPRVLVIEANGETADAMLDQYMKRRGYIKAGRLSRTNNFYCRNYLDAIRLSMTRLDCTISVAPHPLHARPGVDDQWQKKNLNEPSLMAQKRVGFASRVSKRLGNIFRR